MYLEDIDRLFSETLNLYNDCNEFYSDIEKDIENMKEYGNHLHEMDARGFNVKLSIQKLEYQIQMKEISFEVLQKRKFDIIKIFKDDVMDLTKILIQYNPRIDVEGYEIHDFLSRLGELESSEDYTENIMEMKDMSIRRLEELKSDIDKFDPEIELARTKIESHYNLGDIVESLKIQKDLTDQKFQQYLSFFIKVAEQHKERSVAFLNELKIEKDEIL
tara:strand:- start:1021 stop:1674 length:654 start_codon:yes stop_codon:yes gene_type:complete